MSEQYRGQRHGDLTKRQGYFTNRSCVESNESQTLPIAPNPQGGLMFAEGLAMADSTVTPTSSHPVSEDPIPAKEGMNRFALDLRYDDPIQIPGSCYSITGTKDPLALLGD